ncbi:MAG: proline dehydrogenase family protein [Nitrospinota bacterium]|nr:proline dehydrogenase family protein [Nitrospinota bacterium]
MRILYPFAKRFIAGEDRATALKNIKSLYDQGFLCTVDVLGESVHSEDQAIAAKNEYLALLKDIETFHRPVDISAKVSALGMDISYDLCKKNVEELIDGAYHHTVRLDMEGSDLTERTLKLGLELQNDHKNLGVVIQAYLRRTERDIQSIIEQGVSTRLCKGAYKEPETLAYQSMDEIRENFLKQAFRLLKEGNLPAIATHDEILIEQIIAFIKTENIPRDSFYFELLYGVRRDIQKALLNKGYQVRIYVPYGKAWLPYTLRRLAERKENIIFVVKNLFRETLGLGKFSKS